MCETQWCFLIVLIVFMMAVLNFPITAIIFVIVDESEYQFAIYK